MKNTENIIFEGYPKKMLCWDNNEMNAKEYIVVCELTQFSHSQIAVTY